MKMKTAMKMFLGSLSVCFALGAMADDATISRVTVQQRWPWSRLTDIDYVLTADPTQRVDIAITAYNGSVPLTLPINSLSGDLYAVSEGAHRIILDPTKTAYTNSEVLTKFSVALTPTPVPLYMIVDLTKAAGADGQTAYVYESDLTNGLWGAWVRNPVTNNGTAVQSVVWTGVSTNNVYKTDKLVLRRVRAGSYQKGDTQTGVNNTTISNDMYVAVFETTQKQWSLVMGTTEGTDTQAKCYVSYYEIRENPANTDDPAVDWPSNTAVNATSFVGKLRAATGLSGFDLPTDAQWEYFCRAGTTTVFNDGDARARYDGTEDDNNGNTNKYMNALGWYLYNNSTPLTFGQTVGGKLPNAWGLYDTHGNAFEWCLDWSTPGTSRVRRGGSFASSASDCRSAFCAGSSPSIKNSSRGFRIVRTLLP